MFHSCAIAGGNGEQDGGHGQFFLDGGCQNYNHLGDG